MAGEETSLAHLPASISVISWRNEVFRTSPERRSTSSFLLVSIWRNSLPFLTNEPDLIKLIIGSKDQEVLFLHTPTTNPPDLDWPTWSWIFQKIPLIHFVVEFISCHAFKTAFVWKSARTFIANWRYPRRTHLPACKRPQSSASICLLYTHSNNSCTYLHPHIYLRYPSSQKNGKGARTRA